MVADFVNLLHPPYTLWHLSYVIIGISFAPVFYVSRSLATLLAFFFGLGIGAHALDEAVGNPLRTNISSTRLYLIGFVSIGIAIAIGVYYALTITYLLLPIISAEAFFAISYNLETFGKRFHSAWVFSVSWGMLPLITGYFVNALTITPSVLTLSVAAGFLTYAQRILSTPARRVRRGFQQSMGSDLPSEQLLKVSEKTLKVLTLVIFLFAMALIVSRIVF